MRLIDADEVIQFSFSPEAGTNEWIEDLIDEVGLSGEVVNFDFEIEEKAQELCKKVIGGMLNLIKTSNIAYDIKKVIEKISLKSFDYYTGSGAAIDVGEAEEIIRRGGIKNKPNIYLFITIFTINWLVHMITDNAKANLMKNNLIQDQVIHVVQILITWLIYIFVI